MRMGRRRALGGKMPPRYTRSEPNTDVNDVPPSPSDHLRGERHKNPNWVVGLMAGPVERTK